MREGSMEGEEGMDLGWVEGGKGVQGRGEGSPQPCGQGDILIGERDATAGSGDLFGLDPGHRAACQ